MKNPHKAGISLPILSVAILKHTHTSTQALPKTKTMPPKKAATAAKGKNTTVEFTFTLEGVPGTEVMAVSKEMLLPQVRTSAPPLFKNALFNYDHKPHHHHHIINNINRS
jgi:hypothetical protein